MTEKDAILGKVSIIKNCLAMIKKNTGLKPESLDQQEHEDVFVLNLQRACQAAIDLAQLIISQNGWELPRSYKHSFEILKKEKVISTEISERMSKMAGFRNVAIHDYQAINKAILKSILTKNLKDFEDFYTAIVKATSQK